MLFGLSNLIRLSLLRPVSPDRNSYSIGITTGIVRVFLTLLTFRSFFLAFLKGLEHRCHIRQPFLAPILFVGLMFLGWLTFIMSEGLTIFVSATTLGRIVSLMGSTVSLALLADLFDFCLFRDSNR
jgi:hypothetical protein